ncbi:Transcription initiation factor TFIID subunit 5 [Histomonas meleagridis]|uniref:Transcription initiation factor TFIID subunit 5 n=1 Tax=Histomonas meleagridis TaxID=135588 RepID=UPI00355A8976|nr:Transcription initiation factor TFIID subunit 5 [Histomonas meleagridis]KAH0806673.1 Transcription initiation factor TFIID subunit 5 [Histomonas meleagridis]
MTLLRPTSTTQREKSKAIEFTANLGFPHDRTHLPSSCSINRYAFELYLENVQRPELLKALSSDHIEHGFKIIAEASKQENLNDLQTLINRIFIYAFLEILYSDKNERATLFIQRQSHYTTLSEDTLRQLSNINIEMTDSSTTIFENIMEPMNCSFGATFYKNLDSFIDESTAPAISHLLKPFLHFDSETNSSVCERSKVSSNRNPELWGQNPNFTPNFFEEISFSRASTNPHLCAAFRMTRDIPTLIISRPKFIAPLLPTITCLNAPKHVECVALDKSSPSFAYSVGSELFYCKCGEMIKLRCHTEAVSSLAISDCGEWLLSCDIIGNVRISNLKNFDRFCEYKETLSCPTSTAFAPKIPHQFVVGTLNGEIYLYATSRRQPQRLLIGHSAGIVSVLIHPNSEYIASTSMDGTIRIWSITLGCCVRLFKAAGKTPTSLRFSHSGKWVMSTSSRGNLTVLDIGSGKTVKTIKPSDHSIVDAVFVANDKLVVCYDKTGNFWFWETHETYGAQVASVRIDRIRIACMTGLDGDEIRLVGCNKQ